MASSFKILTFTWTRRVLWLQWMTWKGVYIPNPDHIQTHESDGDVQDFFPLMIFMSMMSLKDAQGCKIPEYPHAARQPPVRPLPTSGFSNLTIFLGSWLMIILFQVLQCCGWFCFMMNRRRLSSSSSLSFSSSLPFFDFLLLQRNSGDRLRKSRRASTCIGGFRGTFTQRQSASTALHNAVN